MWSDVGAVAGKLDTDSGNVVSLIASKYEVWYLINFQLLFNVINAALIPPKLYCITFIQGRKKSTSNCLAQVNCDLGQVKIEV